ncbi:MAG: phosphate/phosphite/phosphonate ABC transporter substrate-binding protein [Chloroflexi bacterium]|nr:phosphate/phosphite/phosphonate ABC transporter substrate-binding protein [Chloroflexota bacterium]
MTLHQISTGGFSKTLKRRAWAIFTLTVLLGTLSSCGQQPEIAGPQFGTEPVSLEVPILSFAIHPLHNPAKLVEAYQPLIDYLNSQLHGAQLKLEASRDYAEFEKKYGEREPEFILPNPWQTLQAMEVGYHVIGMAGEPQDFKGLFVVRKDSGLKNPADLKGKAVSYPSPTALAACIMPQYFLYEHGVNINTEIENHYVGSQESSIMNAYMGLTAAGATWPPPWRAFQKDHPQEASELEVIWETESLINNSVMVRDDIPPEVAEQISRLLIGLSETSEGKLILAGMETTRFLPASDTDYDIVRQYIATFELAVRPVKDR